MKFCQGKSKASVSFLFGDGFKDIVTTKNTALEVLLNQDVSGVKCWRYSGRGVENEYSYEHFACGENPTFVPYDNGFNLYMDGALLIGTWYQYLSPSVTQVNSVKYNPKLISSGDCSGCSACQIIVNDSTGNIYKRSGECPVTYKVSCDDECPPDHCKCPTIKYPGYCCLPCKEIAARINNLAARI